MSDSVKEQLSAYLDGELSREEVALLAKRVGRDAELGASLGRYALISESLKGERPAAASADFAANVMAALDAEPEIAARPAAAASQWGRRMRPVAGLAVAASVAAVAIISIQRPAVGPAVVADNEAPSASIEVIADPEPSYTVPTTTQSSAFVPAARLTNYVVAHSEYSSPLGRRTVLSGVLSEDDGGAVEPADETPVVETTVTTPTTR
jgi:sigma-E factor negative regulatory protein RseA